MKCFNKLSQEIYGRTFMKGPVTIGDKLPSARAIQPPTCMFVTSANPTLFPHLTIRKNA